MLSSFFFFFKQKTAYEMRISDWSSDVCSSDLNLCRRRRVEAARRCRRVRRRNRLHPLRRQGVISMTLIEFAALFTEQKTWFVASAGLSKDALHIYFGLALFVAVRLVWRCRGGWLETGRAPVRTPVTYAKLVYRTTLEHTQQH